MIGLHMFRLSHLQDMALQSCLLQTSTLPKTEKGGICGMMKVLNHKLRSKNANLQMSKFQIEFPIKY